MNFSTTISSDTGISTDATSASAAGAGFFGLIAAARSPYIRRSLISLHYALLLGGMAALVFLAAMFFKPELADRFKAASPFAQSAFETDESAAEAMQPLDAAPVQTHRAVTAVTPVTPLNPTANVAASVAVGLTDAGNLMQTLNKAPVEPRQKLVSDWLSKRYRVATDATQMLVSSTFQTAKEVKLDPLLILAVMAIESRFNPFAESPVGAQGLMQVMSKVHRDKFKPLGGVKAALDPAANIRVGSLILKDYVRRGGSLEAGLKMYVGAAAFDSDFGYGHKVLAEYARLKDVASGKRVPTFVTAAVPKAPAPKPVAELAAEATQVPSAVEAKTAEVKTVEQEGFSVEVRQSKNETSADAELSPI